MSSTAKNPNHWKRAELRSLIKDLTREIDEEMVGRNTVEYMRSKSEVERIALSCIIAKRQREKRRTLQKSRGDVVTLDPEILFVQDSKWPSNRR
jgi:hypothetical protein